jgi:capsular polysaccharide biosynthesis protein
MEQKANSKTLVTNAFDLVGYIWEKKWILIALTSVAFIASIVVSLLITPRFKSGVVLFPAASVSLSKSLVETSSISTDNRDVLSFGEDEEAERMLQILHSNQIKDHVVRKFDLMKHYEIDMSAPFPYTRLEKKYKSNIKFRRTEFMSIEIEVLDTDPQMAADMANEIAAYIDSTIHNMQRERALEAFNIVEKEFLNAGQEIKLISDSLQKIRQLGVIDYQSQAASLNTAYANAISRGDRTAAEVILYRMNVLSKYGGIYNELSKKLESEILRLGQLKAKYVSSKVNVEQSLPQIFIVDKAVKAEKKAVPKRSIIVIISSLSVFAFSLLILLIIDQIKSVNR